jgi:hypothetical protein
MGRGGGGGGGGGGFSRNSSRSSGHFSGGGGRGGGRGGSSGFRRSGFHHSRPGGFHRSRISYVYSSVSQAGVLIFIAVWISIAIFGTFSWGRGSIAESTYQRVPLDRSITIESDYLNDEAGWLSNRSSVTGALEYFFEKTGVQPYLWISDTPMYNDPAVVEDMLKDEYSELFTDEGHIIVLFYEPSPNTYDIYWVKGKAAESVVDVEGMDILVGYFHRYYSYDYDDNEYFSQVFIDAADRMMEITPDWKLSAIKHIVFVIVFVVVAFFIRFLILSALKRRQQNIDILNADIGEEIDIEDEADRKAKEYE